MKVRCQALLETAERYEQVVRVPSAQKMTTQQRVELNRLQSEVGSLKRASFKLRAELSSSSSYEFEFSLQAH